VIVYDYTVMSTTRYTVKQLADMAGVSRRTLHYYDEIGLLPPADLAENGYRAYADADLLRLQQILFFRELGFSLKEIGKVIDRPDFDQLQALRDHRGALEKRAQRLDRLIGTIDKTLLFLEGRIIMDKKTIFEGFSEEQQKQYEEEARQTYDPELVDQSVKSWNSYSQAQKEQIGAEGEANYHAMFENMDKGHDSPEVQATVARWHKHIEYFYTPTYEILRGLGQLYTDDPRFRKNFEKLSPEFPDFLRKAIEYYCDQAE
jgi:DNA-binding transcriptional MerR regulator